MNQTIIQRLNAVMAEPDAAYIQKNQKRINGQYTAVSHDQVARKLQPLFAKHGIIVAPRLTSGATVQTGRSTKNGNPIIRFEGIYDVHFYGLEGDSITITVPAHADDEGDKAPGKATSYAVKSALLKVTMMESGDDEEERVDGSTDNDTAPPVGMTPEKLAEITAAINGAGTTEQLKRFVTAGMKLAKLANDQAAHTAIKDAGIARKAALDGATTTESKPAEEKKAATATPPAVLKLLRKQMAAADVNDEWVLEQVAGANKGEHKTVDALPPDVVAWLMNDALIAQEKANASA